VTTPDQLAANARRRRRDLRFTRVLFLVTGAMVGWSIYDGDAYGAAILAFICGLAAKEAIFGGR